MAANTTNDNAGVLVPATPSTTLTRSPSTSVQSRKACQQTPICDDSHSELTPRDPFAPTMATKTRNKAAGELLPVTPGTDFFDIFPAEIRELIWESSIPAGRVVDLVYDKDQNRYFSFHAKIPTILHLCLESRVVGLKTYQPFFRSTHQIYGTTVRPPLIPFDPKRDCILFDDWLVDTLARPTEEFMSQLPDMIGDMSFFDRRTIERIALSSGFYQVRTFRALLQTLLQTFPSLNYLVFTFEDRNPYIQGPVSFRKLGLRDWCCERCLVGYTSGIVLGAKDVTASASIGTAFSVRDLRKSLRDAALKVLFPSRATKDPLEVRLRGVCRGGKAQPFTCMFHQLEEAQVEDFEEEYMVESTNPDDDEYVEGQLQEWEGDDENSEEDSHDDSEEEMEQLEEGELESLAVELEERAERPYYPHDKTRRVLF